MASQTGNGSLLNGSGPNRNLQRFVRKNGLQIGILGVMVVLWLVFLILAPTTFGQGNIYAAFMQSVPFFGIVAMPLTMLVIGRDIDLSFPSIMAISVTAFVLVFRATNDPTLAFVACMATGMDFLSSTSSIARDTRAMID